MPTKTWVVGEEVLAADFNSYVQRQVVATFPNAAGRTAGLPAPTAGMVTFLTDLQTVEVWDGAAWRPMITPRRWMRAFNTGRVTGVNAVTGAIAIPAVPWAAAIEIEWAAAGVSGDPGEADGRFQVITQRDGATVQDWGIFQVNQLGRSFVARDIVTVSANTAATYQVNTVRHAQSYVLTGRLVVTAWPANTVTVVPT